MADIYSAKQQYFQDTPYLEYGGYQVKPTEWMMENNPTYTGGDYSLYYSKSDPTQAFKVNKNSSEDMELQEYLKGYGGVNNLQADAYSFSGAVPQFSLQELAEKERQAGLLQQMQSGQLTEAQATASANNPPASAPLKSEQIQSGEVPYGDWQSSEPKETNRERNRNSTDDILSPESKPGFVTGRDGRQYQMGSQEYTDYLLSTTPGQEATVEALSARGRQGPIDYTFHRGDETVAEYNARIAKAEARYSGSQGTGGTGSPTDSGFADTQTGNGFGTGGQGQAPSSFIGLYKDIIKELGLTDIKKEFKKVLEEQSKLQNELNDGISEINDNPWLSEGVRVKEVEKLKEKYETKLEILTNKQQIYDSLYKEGVQQAQWLATGEYNAQADAAALAEKRYEAQLKLLEINPANFKEINGGLYDIEGQRWLVEPSLGDTNDLKEYQFAAAQGYQGSFLDWQKQSANLKEKAAGGGIGGFLSAAGMNSTINQIVGGFDNEQIVKDYNAATTQYQLMNSLGVNGKNPGDDIAFIYAFAKLMDPNSVVREGEYATIQKYAQSLLTKTELNAVRTVKNSNFLSAEAKQNLLNTARAKLGVMQNQYGSLQSQYQSRIDNVQGGGFNTLTNYGAAYPATIQQAAPTYSSGTGTTSTGIKYQVITPTQTTAPAPTPVPIQQTNPYSWSKISTSKINI